MRYTVWRKLDFSLIFGATCTPIELFGFVIHDMRTTIEKARGEVGICERHLPAKAR